MPEEYRPTWRDRWEYALARALEGGVSVLPDGAARRVGEAVGALVRAPLGIRRETVDENLRRAFPGAAEEWLARVARETYAHLGREAVAMARLSRLDPATIVERTLVPQWDEVLAAHAEGRGLLFVTGHFGNWEMAAAAVAARGVPIEAVVKRQRNRLVDARIEGARRRLGVETIDMGSAPRRIPRALSKGHAIGIVADQDARDAGVWIPFFGVPASTYRGPALFALRFGVPVFASSAMRLPDGRYLVEAFRVPVERSGDLEADTVSLTRALSERLEATVRRAPEQYFWFHKRWKTAPPGEPVQREVGTRGPGREEG